MSSYEFDDVDAFTAGAVGEPGRRVFFLQARSGGKVVTLKCEKQQVQALGDYLRRLLNDLPPAPDRPLAEAMEPRRPDEVDWVVGPMGLAFDADVDRFVLMIEQVIPVDDEGEPEPEALDDQGHLRLRLTRGQAIAFCDRAGELVKAGRPDCIFCGRPKNPDGHACPRMN